MKTYATPMLALVPIALFPACSSSGGGSGGSDALAFSGLKVGATWTYKNTDLNEVTGVKETTVIKEITGCEMVSYVQCDDTGEMVGEMVEYNAYVQETTGGAADAEDANTLYMVAVDEGVVRVRQDVINNGTFEQYIT